MEITKKKNKIIKTHEKVTQLLRQLKDLGVKLQYSQAV
jgi:hypothetical protein